MNKRDFLAEFKNGEFMVEDTISNLIPYLLENVSYAIPVNSSKKLRKYFAAAIYKYNTTDDSFEEILNQLHDENFTEQNAVSTNEKICYLISSSVQIISKVIDNFGVDIKEEDINISAGENLFFLSASRLKETFKSAVILLQNGFFVEILPLFRLIHEQLCWLCYLLQETEEKNIFKNKTQSNVKYLKSVLGNEHGKLYGQLSSEAHLEPETINKYIKIEEDKVYIKGRSGKKCSEEIPTLILLFETYVRVIYHGFKQIKLCSEKMEYYYDFINCELMTCDVLYKAYREQKGLQFTDYI